MDFGFISRLAAHALSLCKYDEELSQDRGFRCFQIARKDLSAVEIEDVGPRKGGYRLAGMCYASRGPRGSMPFNVHYWMLSIGLVERLEV